MPRQPTDATPAASPDRLPFPAEELLASIESIAYLADEAGIILAISRGPFLLQNEDPLTPWDRHAAIGANLFDIVQGADVRGAYRTLHRAVWEGQLPTYGFEYRCDAPAIERRMRMSLSLVRSAGQSFAVLYHSIVISETPRVPLPLFAFGARPDRARPRHGPVVTLCSYCQRVAWPPASAPEERAWIEAAEFYRRGGREDAIVSHGLCDDCFQRVVEPATRDVEPRKPRKAATPRRRPA